MRTMFIAFLRRKQITELQFQYEKTFEDKEFLEARIEQRGMQVGLHIV